MGTKQGVKFYDDAFELDKYKCKYDKSFYFPLWGKIISEYLLKNDKMLELGCGTGQFAHYLWDKGFINYYGVDFSPVAISTARGFSKQIFGIADIEKDNEFYNGEEFKTILCLETLEHIDDIETISKIKSGITFIATVPSFDDKGHVRHFKNMNEITNRYEKFINFDKIEKFDIFWIFKGIIN